MRADVPGTLDEQLKSFLSGKLRLTACGLTTAALLSPLALAQQRSSQPPSPSVAVGHHIAQPAPPPTAPSMLDRYLKQLDYEQLQRAVEAMPQSSDRDYFAGVLANRCGRVAESIALLARVLPQIKSSNASRGATALRALAADFSQSGHRSDSADRASRRRV
jgi:hypothetical protein